MPKGIVWYSKRSGYPCLSTKKKNQTNKQTNKSPYPYQNNWKWIEVIYLRNYNLQRGIIIQR